MPAISRLSFLKRSAANAAIGAFAVAANLEANPLSMPFLKLNRSSARTVGKSDYLADRPINAKCLDLERFARHDRSERGDRAYWLQWRDQRFRDPVVRCVVRRQWLLRSAARLRLAVLSGHALP